MAEVQDDWRRWAAHARRTGATPQSVFETMRKRGFGLGQSREIAFGADAAIDPDTTPDPSGRTLQYEELTRPALARTKAAGLSRIPSKKAQIYRWDGFLDEDTCAALVALSDTSLARSITVISDDAHPTRTSETSQLGLMDAPLVKATDVRIATALGVSLAYSEPIQAQKYSAGQEYKAHYDFLAPGSADYDKFGRGPGQRTWTFMVYLNEGCEGGGTRFRKLDKTFQPKTGRAVIWNNLTADGDPNPNTLHQGMKVRSGAKYIITKWFRDKGDGALFI